MHHKKANLRFIITGICLFFVLPALAQDDLLKELEQTTEPVDTKIQATFKGSRIINGHSVETRPEGVLDFLISHRFGRINSGAYEFFGLDQSNIRLGLEYGITDRLNIGIGRSSFQKVFDGYVKYKLLWQQIGEKRMPVSVVWFSSATINSTRRPEEEINLDNRMSYTHQLLIGRKFGNDLSLQLTPTLVHRNLVLTNEDKNDIFALGFGGRYKITNRVALNAEYFYRFNADQDENTYNAIAIGVDIETGGHVFQLHFTNAQSMVESGFIPETTGNFFEGDIHFGFNISRVFQLK
jgi:hypothetical protein